MTKAQKDQLLDIWAALDKRLKELNDIAPEIKSNKEAALVDGAVTALTTAVSKLTNLLPN